MKSIKGFLKFEDEIYNFFYENRILCLYPKSKDDRVNELSLGEGKKRIEKVRQEKIDKIYLDGYLPENGKEIKFEVLRDESSNNGFTYFNVCSYYIYEKERIKKREIKIEECKYERKQEKIENKINEIIILGREINYFFSPEQVYTNIQDGTDEYGNKLELVAYKTTEKRCCGELTWKEIDIKIYVRSKISLNTDLLQPISLESELIVDFSKSVDLEYLKEIIEALKSTFVYLCKRESIEFKLIQTAYRDENENKIFGEYIIIDNEKVDEINVNLKKYIIKYEYLKEKFIDLVKKILDGELYIEHIPQSLKETENYNLSHMLLDFTAFESEFNNIYPEDKVRSEQFIEVKKDLLEEIESYEKIKSYTGKRKKYLKNFMRNIEHIENGLGEKIKHAIKDSKKYIDVFFRYYYSRKYNKKEMDDMCERMNKIRNQLAHGNFLLELTKDNIFDFKILECLLYIMRLKNLGLLENQIYCAVCGVMKIKIEEIRDIRRISQGDA